MIQFFNENFFVTLKKIDLILIGREPFLSKKKSHVIIRYIKKIYIKITIRYTYISELIIK